MNRRDIVRSLGVGLLASAPSAGYSADRAETKDDGRAFLLPQHFGAKADGKTLDTNAINKAIDQASGMGGGTVYLRAGTYLCGTIVLKSRVRLYLEGGAVVLGSKNIHDYAAQSGPVANADAGQRHLIFASHAEDVTIAGAGTIDGQGPSFWVPAGRKKVPLSERWHDVATFDLKPLARISPMLEFVACKRLRIDQIRIENSPGWTMRLANCVGVVIDGIAIKNPVVGPNCDGIDISGSSNVRIANSLIDTADDAICLKSENAYGKEVSMTRNIVITNCLLSGCCNGLKFGTAGEAGFENITFSNSVIFNDDVDLSARVIAGIALEVVDGGWLEGVTISGIRMQRTRTPIFLRLGNRTPHSNGSAGRMKGIMISDVYATDAVLTSSITGIPGFAIEDVTLSNIRVDTVEEGKREWSQNEVPERINAYPEANMFKRLPAYGLYCRHVRGMRLMNLDFGSSAVEQRPAIVCDDVRQLDIEGLRVPMSGTGFPVIQMTNAQDVWLRGGRAPKNTPSYLHVDGTDTANVLMTDCDLRNAGKAFSTQPGLAADAVLSAASNVFKSE